MGRDAVLAPGVGPCGEEAQNRRLAPVATSHARGEGVFQLGPLDATREEPAGPSRSLYQTLPPLGRSSRGELQGAGAGRCGAIPHGPVSDCPCSSANGPSRAASSERRDDRAHGACVTANDVEDAASPERGHRLRIAPPGPGTRRRERPSVSGNRECGPV